MNVDDVATESIECPPRIIAAIFSDQRRLMEKYAEVERSNRVDVPLAPWHIDNRRVQFRLKDMFWRFTEELCEAAEELEINAPSFTDIRSWESRWDTDHHIRHFFEEIVDGLHFLTEASITANMDADDLEDFFESHTRIPISNPGPSIHDIRSQMFQMIYHLGLAANCLKNKPWKLTEMPTDREKFRGHLTAAWTTFFVLWRDLNGSREMFYILYAKKHEVNKFRIRTNY